MDFSKIKFEAKDFVKGIILVSGLLANYFALRMEIHDNKTFDQAEKQVINYKLTALEECCDRYFIKPKSLTIKAEK